MTGNKILITGGGSGIGLALTEAFLKEGNTIIICGRRRDLLEDVQSKHPSVIIRVCDLSDSVQRVELSEWISNEHPDTNVLINNAGIQQWMNLHDTDFMNRAEEEIETNILAPVHLCHLFSALPSIKTIINVTSGLAFSPLTRTPVYSATKAFMRSFTLSLRYLLKEKGIEVIEMIPPALNTDLGGKGIHDAYPPVSEFIQAIMPQLKAGKQELTFGFSDAMLKSGPDQLKATFDRMNP